MSKYTREEILQHRAEWVAALRSGKYPQTRNKLRDENGYCCLGVACDLAGLVGELDRNIYRYPDRLSYGEVISNGHTLPRAAREWLGVSDSTPFSTEHDPNGAGDSWGHSSGMNDNGSSFPEIADHFEEYGFHPSIDVLAQEETEGD